LYVDGCGKNKKCKSNKMADPLNLAEILVLPVASPIGSRPVTPSFTQNANTINVTFNNYSGADG